MDLVVLAKCLENLQQFEALFETHGIETVVGYDGERYNLFDLKQLYGYRFLLPQEEAIAIEVSLYHSANGGYAPDDPYIIGILRKLCTVAGVEYKEPELVLLSNSGELNLLGGFL